MENKKLPMSATVGEGVSEKGAIYDALNTGETILNN